MAPAGSAIQVTLGFDGIPWILTNQRSTGAGNVIQYYSGGAWQTIPNSIGAAQIAGSTNGFCWFVDENNAIWSVDTAGTPIRMSADGVALSVGVGNFGPAWAISTQSYESGGGNIILWYNQANGQWTQVPAPAAAVQIAGQYDETAWVVNADNAIYNVQQNGTSTLMSPNGTATQVGIGPDRMPWMISTQSNNSPGGGVIMSYANGTWNPVPYPASATWVAGSL